MSTVCYRPCFLCLNTFSSIIMEALGKEVKLCWEGQHETIMAYVPGLSKVTGGFVIQCDDGEVEINQIVLSALSTKLCDVIEKLKDVESSTLVLPGASVTDIKDIVSLAVHGKVLVSVARRTSLLALITRLGMELELEEEELVQEVVIVDADHERDILLMVDDDESEDQSFLDLDTVEVFVKSDETVMEGESVKFCSVCRLTVFTASLHRIVMKAFSLLCCIQEWVLGPITAGRAHEGSSHLSGLLHTATLQDGLQVFVPSVLHD
jgi:hypothetical protein